MKRLTVALAFGVLLCGDAAAQGQRMPQVVASVAVNSPAAIAIGAGSVWVSGGSALIRIDPKTNRVVARIPMPGWPSGLAVADGLVWVARNPVITTDESARPGWLWSINPATNRVFGKPVRLELPTQIAAGAGSLWVTNGNHGVYGRVFRVDPKRRLVVATVKVPGDPEGIVAQARSIWVAASDTGNVVQLDPGTAAVLGQALHVGSALLTLAAAPDRLWVGDSYSGAVVQVDPERPDHLVITRTPLPTITDVAVGDSMVWATTAQPSQLVELDPATGALIGKPLPLPAGASGLALGFGSIWVVTSQAVERVRP